MNRSSFFRGVLLASRIPNLLIVGLTQLLAASMLVRHNFGELVNLELFLLCTSTMLVAAGGYIINDYYDAKIDMVNRPERVVVGTVLSRRKAIISHVAISVVALILGFLISWKIAALHGFSIFFLWYYSNHLRRYFIGKIVIAILAALTVLAVGMAFETVSYRLMAFSAFAGAIIWIRELLKDLENADGERVFGVESVPEVWGAVGTKWLIATIGCVGIGLLVYFMLRVDSRLFFLFYLCMIPVVVLFAYLLIRSDRKEHFRRLRHLTNFFIIAGLLSMLVI